MASEEPKLLVKLPLNFQAKSMGTIGGYGKRREHQEMAPWRGLLLAILANYTIFGASGEYLAPASRPIMMHGRNLLFILDTLVFTDHGNMKSTSREEPPKMVTFHEK